MVDSTLPNGEEYAQFLDDLKTRIHAAQVRTALAVNRELLLLYWQIGRDLLEHQQERGWGTKIIDRLASDLRRAFPHLKGFSRRNLHYMRAFASAYPDEQCVQEVVAQLPWGHNVRLLDAVSDPTERDWYARKGAPFDPGRLLRAVATAGAEVILWRRFDLLPDKVIAEYAADKR